MNVGVVLNEAYIKYLYVMLVSFLESNSKEKVRVYVTYENIETEKLNVYENLEKRYNCELHFICLDDISFPDYLPVNDEWPMMIYYHLLFGELLDESVERILYLDTDVIVHKDLKELYEMDFEDNYIIACDDMSLENGYEDLTDNQKKLFYNQRDNFRYFNTGMMLLNLKKIREDFNFEKWLMLAKNNENLLFAPDQDLVNLGYYGKVKYVDSLKYNMFAKTSYNKGITIGWTIDNNYIIHYAGRKPWQHEGIRYSLERFWWDYASKTIFYTELLENLVYNEINSCYIEQLIRKLNSEKTELYNLLIKIEKYMK